VEPFVIQGRWRASGTTAGVGVAWDPTQLLRVSGSARWSGGLELTPSAGAVDDERTYAIPLQLRAGATFSLTSGFAVTVGGAYADWSETGEDLTDGATRGGTWSYGGGVEWSSGQLLGRPLPLRIGVRQVDLPFHFEGEAVSERLLSGGFGLYLLETETIPLARMEVSLERGTRSGGGISEDFLRTTISVRVAGN
jgi:hypothetical protein